RDSKFGYRLVRTRVTTQTALNRQIVAFQATFSCFRNLLTAIPSHRVRLVLTGSDSFTLQLFHAIVCLLF
ncbi:MAG TPA: hypothetical protein VHP35_04755, partial [Terriglobia bacterium]|nr:hypothetical protein [Terriglobia bacterium]